MKRILVPLADGFEEIEAVTIIDVLRRAGLRVITAGLTTRLVSGAHEVVIQADTLLSEVKDLDFDAVILPGGMPGTTNLQENQNVIHILKRLDSEGRWVGAICAAPTVLKSAGVIRDRQVTSYPAFQEDLSAFDYRQDRVVVDEHLVTSRGPGTALEFSLRLVSLLAGTEKADELAKGMIV